MQCILQVKTNQVSLPNVLDHCHSSQHICQNGQDAVKKASCCKARCKEQAQLKQNNVEHCKVYGAKGSLGRIFSEGIFKKPKDSFVVTPTIISNLYHLLKSQIITVVFGFKKC